MERTLWQYYNDIHDHPEMSQLVAKAGNWPNFHAGPQQNLHTTNYESF